MAFSSFTNVSIQGIAGCVPSQVVKNSEYPHLFTEKEKKRLIKTVGIKERRIAPDNVTASDLGYVAANNLIDQLAIDRAEIKGLVFLSQTPDYKIPFTSNILQERLGLNHDCTCLDINAGCSGFITGLQTAFSLTNGISDGKILFIIAETCSKFLSDKDKATSLLFGDGAAALILTQSKEQSISCFDTYSDGSHFDAIIIPDGGYRNRFSRNSLEKEELADGSLRDRTELHMRGADVFDFTMREVVPSVKQIQEKFDAYPQVIDYFIFHQANRFIINQIAMDLDIPKDKLVLNIDRFGNTSGVSIPLAMVTELSDKIGTIGHVHCVGYGAGLSWGNAVLDLSKTKILPLKEL